VTLLPSGTCSHLYFLTFPVYIVWLFICCLFVHSILDCCCFIVGGAYVVLMPFSSCITDTMPFCSTNSLFILLFILIHFLMFHIDITAWLLILLMVLLERTGEEENEGERRKNACAVACVTAPTPLDACRRLSDHRLDILLCCTGAVKESRISRYSSSSPYR